MKVVTEERLSEILANADTQKDCTDRLAINAAKAVLITLIEQECQELDRLTVTKLRPMSEAPRDGSYIKVIFWSGTNPGHSEMFVCWNEKFEAWEEYMVDPEEETLDSGNFDGWIPIPQYKPEQP